MRKTQRSFEIIDMFITIGRPNLTLLLSSACLLMMLVKPLAADDKVFAAIVKVQSEREKIYGNGHFVWMRYEIWEGETTKTRLEYWARDHQYFRLDSQTTIDGQQPGAVERWIARPDGVVKINAASSDDPGKIMGNVRSAASEVNIKGQSFIAMANRLATVQVPTLLTRWMNRNVEQTEYKDLKLVQNDSEGVVITFSRVIVGATKRYTVRLSQSDFRVLSWNMRAEGDGDGRWAEHGSKVIYQKESLDIPIGTRDTFAGNVGTNDARYECKLKVFQLSPAPLEVFFNGWDAPNEP